MLDNSLADNYKMTYGMACQVFQQFHEAAFGMTGDLSFSPNQVAMFVAYMDRAGHACAMVRTHVSALSHAHRMVDMDDPTTGQLEVTFISFKHHRGESQSPECCKQPVRKYARPDCCQSMRLSDRQMDRPFLRVAVRKASGCN